MEETQKYHPAAIAVKEVCQKVFRNPNASPEKVMGHVVPLTAIMMLFTNSHPSSFFSKEFLAILSTEREIFLNEHEFSACDLVMALEAEAKRILDIE